MDKKNFISLIFLFLITISLFSSISFADRSYSIPLINEDIYIQNDGSIHVKETIHYSFQGTYHGIHRNIPLNGQKIENLKVTSKGAYCNYSMTNKSKEAVITVYLYSDAEKTIPITDKNVDVTFDYDFLNVIKFYNDIAELQYLLVGSDWNVDIGQMVANIHLKSNNDVKYWLNPPYYTDNSSWENNTLLVTSKTISSGEWFEVRMLIPKNQFSINPINGIIINKNGAEAIEKMQTDYQNGINFKSMLYSALSILIILSCFIPLGIYWKYGREPKIDYKAAYERDLPTNDPPAIVNAICGSGFSKKIGEPDMDGFKATIMDLINRKYISIYTEANANDDTSRNIFFKLNPSKSVNQLQEFEVFVYDFLKHYEKNGTISLEEISNKLSKPENAKIFNGTYLNWKGTIKSQFTDDEKLQKYFLKKGDSLMKFFGKAGLVVAIILFFVSFYDMPLSSNLWWSAILLGLISIVSSLLPQKIGGQWTTYGEEYDAKWNNFRKYIKDFSLLKEYPPESIKIWNYYLVYATALGEAEAVKKAMELTMPREELDNSDLFLFHYYGGYALMTDSFNFGTSSSANGGDFGSIGDIGDIGGGFGGGGGDAF